MELETGDRFVAQPLQVPEVVIPCCHHPVTSNPGRRIESERLTAAPDVGDHRLRPIRRDDARRPGELCRTASRPAVPVFHIDSPIYLVVRPAFVNDLARGTVTEEHLAIPHASCPLFVETVHRTAHASEALVGIDAALRFGVRLLRTVEIVVPDDSRIRLQGARRRHDHAVNTRNLRQGFRAHTI